MIYKGHKVGDSSNSCLAYRIYNVIQLDVKEKRRKTENRKQLTTSEDVEDQQSKMEYFQLGGCLINHCTYLKRSRTNIFGKYWQNDMESK